jgi:Gas vesicle synthesis protein GvpL/GvpF
MPERVSRDHGVWVYAVLRGPAEKRMAGLAGRTAIGGAPLRGVESAGLVAVVASVGLDEFGEQPLRRNLEDLDWLAATARAHDAVVDAVAGTGPVVPLRLATVYLDDAGVSQMLQERRADLDAALDLVEGRTEWGVKVFGDPGALASPAQDEGQPHEQAAGKGAGTAYLQRRRAQRQAQETGEQEAAAQAERIHTELARLAVASTRHPPQDPQLSGTRTRMLLNGAYLVDDARAEEFAVIVRGLDAEPTGVTVELTGPWPTYSFAGLEAGR